MALIFAALPAAANADTVEITTTTTTIWRDAPIYTGPVVEAELRNN